MFLILFVISHSSRLFSSFDANTQKIIKKEEEKYKQERIEKQLDDPIIMQRSKSAHNSPTGKEKTKKEQFTLQRSLSAGVTPTNYLALQPPFTRELSQGLLETNKLQFNKQHTQRNLLSANPAVIEIQLTKRTNAPLQQPTMIPPVSSALRGYGTEEMLKQLAPKSKPNKLNSKLLFLVTCFHSYLQMLPTIFPFKVQGESLFNNNGNKMNPLNHPTPLLPPSLLQLLMHGPPEPISWRLMHLIW